MRILGALRGPVRVYGLGLFALTALFTAVMWVSGSHVAARTAVDPEVLAAREAAWRMYFDGDAKGLGNLLPEEFIGIGMNEAPFAGRAKTLEDSRAFHEGGGRLVRLTFPEIQAQRFGDVVVLYGRFEAVIQSQGTERTLRGRLTEVFVRRGRQVGSSGLASRFDRPRGLLAMSASNSGQQQAQREERGLTPRAFERLLEWLDDGSDSCGKTYLEMRRRLIFYFDRRNRPFPDDLADDTLNRIAWTLEEDGAIAVTPPARYCYVVARFVLLEDTRRREHTHISLSRPDRPEPFGRVTMRLEVDEGLARREQRLDCLDRCVETLPRDQHSLIVDYYRDERRAKIDRRRALAQRLGITMNALAVRACRIRDALEACVLGCCQER